jgi:hypothetical protein
MNDTVEKSCWGIALWTVAIVLVIAFVFGTLTGGDTAAIVADTVSN